MSYRICLECGKMFNCDYDGSWVRDFCQDCLREVFEENKRDGERDERGQDE